MIPTDLSTWTDSLSTAGGIASRTFLVIVFTIFILLGAYLVRSDEENGLLNEIEGSRPGVHQPDGAAVGCCGNRSSEACFVCAWRSVLRDVLDSSRSC